MRAVEGWLARRSCDELLLVIGDAVRRRAELAGALSRMGLPISSSEASSYNGIRALAELSLRVHGCGEFKKWFVRVAALLVRDNHDVEAALASGWGTMPRWRPSSSSAHQWMMTTSSNSPTTLPTSRLGPGAAERGPAGPH
ncbi:hypothetical protein [Vulcanisaeta sp. JCM 16159]|uniref:hypothetical protein n=1 Tax=Vulcanisaeta sp. JCM 16159 TaxID=1295371 RepID=UPI001FB217A6|nr:hypothetical protein [Vulcanisaeta sp. JCM 16159]